MANPIIVASLVASLSISLWYEQSRIKETMIAEGFHISQQKVLDGIMLFFIIATLPLILDDHPLFIFALSIYLVLLIHTVSRLLSVIIFITSTWGESR